MSYILEALKKSEQERQIGHVPDISMVQETPVRAAARWPRWILVAFIVNVLILVAIAWKPWETHPTQQVEHAAEPAKHQAAVATPEQSAPAVPEPAPDLTAPAPAEPVEAPLPAPVTQMPLPAPAPVYQPEPVQYETEPVLPPRLQDLPLDERSNLPAPRIDVHVFAREPDRRFVLIKLRKYQEGDTLDEGATIESILADGIVLSYQGQRYRVERP